jgi:predicted RNase H-like HicB family nuclease
MVNPQDILKAPYSRILIPDDDGTFSAEILEFQGCFSQGATPNEAFNNLEDAARAWVEASLAQGLEIPPPAMNIGYKGKIALRIPRSLHKRAAQFAERDGISLNQFLISAIASKIGAEEYHSYMVERIEKLIACTTANTLVIQANIQYNLSTINLPFFKPADTKEAISNVRGN